MNTKIHTIKVHLKEQFYFFILGSPFLNENFEVYLL